MKLVSSIWLVPKVEDEKYLRDIINKLAKENDFPEFIPHLTLFPNIYYSIEEIKEIMNDVFENQKPFKIQKTKISQSNNFWKTVFIEFELNDTLKDLFQKMSARTDNRDISTFQPHISLVYKNIPEEDRIKIVNSLTTKNEFTIDRVFVNMPKAGDEDYFDIPNHRQPYKIQFS